MDDLTQRTFGVGSLTRQRVHALPEGWEWQSVGGVLLFPPDGPAFEPHPPTEIDLKWASMAHRYISRFHKPKRCPTHRIELDVSGQGKWYCPICREQRNRANRHRRRKPYVRQGALA